MNLTETFLFVKTVALVLIPAFLNGCMARMRWAGIKKV